MTFVLLALAVGAFTWGLAFAKRVSSSGKITISFALPGLAVLIVGSVFGYDFFNADTGPIPLTLDRVLLVLLCGVFAVLIVRKRAELTVPDATDWLVITLLCALLASALLTDWGYAEKRPISRWLFFYLMPATLYFLVRNTQLRDLDLKLVSAGLVLFGLYLAITAIFESRGLYSLVYPAYIRNEQMIEFLGRGRGPFLNPVSNGMYLTACLGAAMLLFWHFRRFAKLAALATLPILLAGGLATLTRSVWVGMAAGAGIIAWFPSNRNHRGFMLVISACLGIVIFFSLGDRLSQFKRDKHVSVTQMSESAQLRPMFVHVAYEMFQKQPFCGCGFGQYGKARLSYIQQPNTDFEIRKAKDYLQHNVFLSFLTETGLLGLSLLVILMFKTAQISMMLFKNEQATYWARGYALLMLCVLAAYIINGMFHDVSICPMVNMLLFFLLAIVANQQSLYASIATSPQLANDQNSMVGLEVCNV